jgi:hypothetical protein
MDQNGDALPIRSRIARNIRKRVFEDRYLWVFA